MGGQQLMTSLVSILIPVYNRETLIGETLASALAQTHQNIEVVVVDNASTDGTWEVIAEYAKRDPRVRVFRNDSNIGPVRNWRRCVDEACGEYGKILWSDDLIDPQFVERALALFDAETAFVYSAVALFNHQPGDGEDAYLLGKTGHYACADYIDHAMADTNVPVSPGCAIFRLRDLRDNLLVDVENRINSDFAMHAIGNDLLIFLLTAIRYPKFGFIAETLSHFRMHEGSITISSESGKIPLHYMLAKTYFVDRFMPQMRDTIARRAFRLLQKYPQHHKFGFSSVDDFFIVPVPLSPLFKARVIVKMFFSRLNKAIKGSKNS